MKGKGEAKFRFAIPAELSHRRRDEACTATHPGQHPVYHLVYLSDTENNSMHRCERMAATKPPGGAYLPRQVREKRRVSGDGPGRHPPRVTG